MPDSRHLNWDAQALWQRLEPLLPGLSVEVLARAESTNTRLLDRARALAGQPDAPVSRPGDLDARGRAERTPHGRRAGDVLPCLLVAEHQTRGRGRQGRGWIGQAGVSLTFSLALPLEPVQWSGLSLAVGVALADALDPRPLDLAGDDRPRIGLKWPNDLWLLDAPGRGRKLGGVLIETVSVGQCRMCVVGVGLNVLPQSGPEVDALAHGFACLHELDPGVSAPAVLAQVAVPLAQMIKRFERDGFAPLAPAFARRDLLRGQDVLTSAPESMQGVADGVDETGALRVLSDGVHRILAGEVSVRLRAADEA